MKLTIGNPVVGDDFFDRELEQRQIWRKLESNHLLMLAPRRIGKTSLIYRLCQTSQDHGFFSLHCSLAGCEDERDCVQELFKALQILDTTGQKAFREALNAAAHNDVSLLELLAPEVQEPARQFLAVIAPRLLQQSGA